MSKKSKKTEQKIKDYLKLEPKTLSSNEAFEMLEHAAKCSRCTKLLSKHSEHFGALLELTHEEYVPSPAVEEMMAKAEQELLMAAKKLLNRLPAEVRERLSNKLSPEMRDRFAEVDLNGDDLAPELLRAALAVSEVSFALETLMSSRRNPDDVIVFKIGENDLLLPNRKVPLSYLFNRISEESGITREVAAVLWDALVNLLQDDPSAIPDIISEVSKEQILFRRKLD
jgi:hypothetical protein